MNKRYVRQVFWSMCLTSLTVAHTAAIGKGPKLYSGQGINWLLKPVATDPAPAMSRAELGTFLFQQPLRPAAEAVPVSGQTGVLPGLFHRTEAFVPLDSHRFILVGGGLAVTPFCTTSFVHGRLQRYCLIDENNDGVFDWQGKVFAIGRPPFSPMMFARPEPASIRYTVKEQSLDPVMTAGLVLRKEGKAYSLRFAISEDGKPNVLELFAPGSGLFASPQRRSKVETLNGVKMLDGTTQKFTADQLPLRIELLGAVLEIVELHESTVAYRVLSGFDPDQVMPVSRSGTLPVTP